LSPRQLPFATKIGDLTVGQFVGKGEIRAGANVLLAKPVHIPTQTRADDETQEQPQCRLHIAFPHDSVDLFAGGLLA